MAQSRANIYKKILVTIFNLSLLLSFTYAQAAKNANKKNAKQATQINAQDIGQNQVQEQTVAKANTQENTQEKIGATKNSKTTQNKKTNKSKNKNALKDKEEDELKELEINTEALKTIKNIIVVGTVLVDKQAILGKIPYKVGEKFDPRRTRKLIHNLYYGLKRIKNVHLYGELVGEKGVNLIINIEEKKVLKEIQFLPKKRSVGDDDLKKKINLTDIPALDDQELKRYELIIKEIYASKNYHNTKITSELKIDTDGRAIAIFNIDEGKKSLVKRVMFEGNKNISARDLRKIIFTREDWILGALDGSGTLQEDRLEGDKHIIEQYYQSAGYMKAKVIKTDLKMDVHGADFTITFYIEEGDRYKVSEVKASGNDILKDEYLVSRIPIKAGDLYSRKKIVDAIKDLEMVWGELGFIFANIEPSIQPDDDNKTVKLAFYTETGEKVFLNKINITGNKKTKDKVIRRKLMLREGDLITNRKKEVSKYGVESLGFFDPKDGVNWQVTRLDKNLADLDLVVKEVKTGHAGIKLGFGGSVESISNANSGFSVTGELNDTNLFGTGMSVALNGQLAKDQQTISFNITDPWLFNKPITGALDIYHKRPSYADFTTIRPMNEKDTGGAATIGFVSPRLMNTQVLFKLGADNVVFENRPILTLHREHTQFLPDITSRNQYQCILDQLFDGGTYVWLENQIGQDRRNHPMHTSQGYRWTINSKLGLPSFNCNIGYFKADFDFSWFTPLIGANDLILKVHFFMGASKKFKNRTIPYRELYHIGGPASVRGFLFGQISPRFCGDPIGGSKAMFTNIELQFPITQDFNLKGVVFYDGGTGWDNPYTNTCPAGITNNTFNYRHAVGFGFRMLNPVPVRIDWGFKLDRKKKLGETPSEVHFGMTYDW